MSYYYDIKDDFEKYPDATIYIIIGGRGRGKTYSALDFPISRGRQFVFVKRTNIDVTILCAGATQLNRSSHNTARLDISPVEPLNRDKGYNIHPVTIPKVEGIAGFWNCTPEGDPVGEPIGYIASLNAIDKVRGFEMSNADYLIFDEFIAQKYERVNQSEGDSLLNMYKTVSRDREHRGKQPLKLILLANAMSIVNPVLDEFNLVDTIASMAINEIEYKYIDNRGILIHLVEDNPEFYEKESQSAIYRAMEGTKWREMALENVFAYDDFSAIGKPRLKGYHCVDCFYYKRKEYYIYRNGNKYCVCGTNGKYHNYYNLDTDAGKYSFYNDWVFELKNATIREKCIYTSFRVYNAIMNFKKVFAIN